ncbi:MAG: nuclear transport factor 2 family protein [Gammaproteobacteria bacterium]|nr:nuclear transport factor 2 family protein [Gammaproteobacteria bacterium]
MPEHPYEYYIDLVTKRYFHSVDNFAVDDALACFQADAFLHEMTSDTRHGGRDTGIRTMLSDFMAAHSRIWHGNMVHTVDIETGSICTQFSVEVPAKDGGGLTRLENCNRFYLRDGLFSEVYVYMSGDNLLK